MTTSTSTLDPATEIRTQLAAFGAAYDYDTSYLQELFDASPGAYEAFAKAMDLSHFRQALPLDAHFVARIVAMQGEDCGPCAQLNIRMAVEAGVSRALLETLIHRPEELPPELGDVRDHVLAVAASPNPDAECAERLRDCYGEAAFAEIAVVVSGCRLFPTVKRALLRADHCEILNLDV